MINDVSHGVSMLNAAQTFSHQNNSCEKFTPTPPKSEISSESSSKRAKGEAESSGFIHSSTSDTRSSYFYVDKYMARARKMKCGVITSARLHEEELKYKKGGYRWKAAFLTLTYKDISAWKPKHITSLIKSIREYLKRKGIEFRYLWVAELQKRGAVHYHLIVWLPKGLSLPKPDKRGWWPHGMTNIQWAKNAVGYVAKYASKGEDSAYDFPKGLRLHGCGGLGVVSRIERAWWAFPKWVRDYFTDKTCRIKRPQGGGILNWDTGEFITSPYRVEIVPGGGVRIFKVN